MIRPAAFATVALIALSAHTASACTARPFGASEPAFLHDFQARMADLGVGGIMGSQKSNGVDALFLAGVNYSLFLTSAHDHLTEVDVVQSTEMSPADDVPFAAMVAFTLAHFGSEPEATLKERVLKEIKGQANGSWFEKSGSIIVQYRKMNGGLTAKMGICE